MNDIKKEIADLKTRIQELENQIAKPKKWSPVGGEYYICNGNAIKAPSSMNAPREFGIERPTKEQVERAVIEMCRFNRLLALRDELCGDDLPDWGSKTSDKWKVYRENKYGEWNVGMQYMQDVGVYFTTKEHAQRACDMLNSGEVEL